jgi:hypothetical protein
MWVRLLYEQLIVDVVGASTVSIRKERKEIIIWKK